MRTEKYQIGSRVVISNPTGTTENLRDKQGTITGTDDHWDWQIRVDGFHDPIAFNETEIDPVT